MILLAPGPRLDRTCPQCHLRQKRRIRRAAKQRSRLNLLLQVISIMVLVLFATLVVSSSDEEYNGHDDDDDHHDYLAEILEEERRLEEEHAKLETEAKEFHAMKARQSSAGGSFSGQQQQNGSGDSGRGNPKIKPGGGKSAKNTMPKGAAAKDFSTLEDQLRQKEAAAAARKASEEEKKQAQLAEQHRLQREAQFEADLAKMNEEQRKAAKKQKRADAKIVRRILNASRLGKHYSVLGLRNWEIKIGPLVLMKVTSKDIKKAYRNLARSVHPDKNKDGRAEEAFDALEKSAAVLSDDELRTEYDRKIKTIRRKRRRETVQLVMDVSDIIFGNIALVVHLFKRMVGPFSVPLFVIGALII